MNGNIYLQCWKTVKPSITETVDFRQDGTSPDYVLSVA